MDSTTVLLILLIAALVSLLVVIIALLRGRSGAPKESPFAASTEGETRCPKCGMGNMWTDRTCISCGSDLPG